MFAAVGSVYANMFNFSGRARRAEYWWFFLFIILMNVALSGGFTFWALTQAPSLLAQGGEAALEALVLQYESLVLVASAVGVAVMVFAVFIPQLAVTVRRLHDTGRSGWWIFKPFLVCVVAIAAVMVAAVILGPAAIGLLTMASLIPIACNIWYIVVMCLPSERGENRFGPDPIADRPPEKARHPALVKEMDEELSRMVAERRREEFRDYYRARVVPAIERNKTRRA
jgi:uncharacterized membrane protein YhaH (DUF805 family)